MGLLGLNRGKWDGKTILSDKWVAMATTPTRTSPATSSATGTSTATCGLIASSASANPASVRCPRTRSTQPSRQAAPMRSARFPFCTARSTG